MATKRRQDNKFNFFVPATFEKSKKNGKEVVRVKGIASTSSTSDSDGETLFPDGFDYTPLLQRGFLNYDHQQKSRPTAIIGEPDVAKVINNGKDFYIEGFLYPDSEEAQQVAQLAEILEKNSPTRRLGYSIEGQVIERDPIDKKKVLKARITGVAITPCPKNPNTILSLMKGEYNDLFVEDDDINACPKCGSEMKDDKCSSCGYMEKAFTAEGNESLRPESVEGVKYDLDKNEVKVGRTVRKSEIYNLIADNYTTDIVKAKQIYSLIENVNSKMFDMKNGEISMEAVNQAFEFLNKAASTDLNKSETQEGNTATNEEEGDTFSEQEPIVKSDSDNDNDGDDFEKAKQMCKGLLVDGLSKGAAIDALVKGGFTLEVAQGAVDSVINAMSSLKENGGQVNQVSAPESKPTESLSKGEIEELFNNTFGQTNDLVKSLSDNMERKFHSVGVLVKKLMDQNELLKGQNDELGANYTEISERLKKIEETPVGRKSVIASAPIERFQKSEENNVGANVYSLSRKEDREQIADFLDAEILKSRNNGRKPAQMLEDAVAELEMCKSIPATVLPYLKANGFNVVK